MNNAILEVIPVFNLLEKNFFVPSYQRGYRWTEQQVNELLVDIWEFSNAKNKSDNEFYCLQPIVIKECTPERKEKNNLQGTWYEVIDGQQRLTSIRIILSYLIKEHLKRSLNEAYKKNEFTLAYETRKEVRSFLDNIQYNEKNIDCFHIYSAYETVTKWFSNKDYNECNRFLATLLAKSDEDHPVKVIWYNIKDETINPIDVFTRINIGKIPLTNSELIKALFLGKVNSDTKNKGKHNIKQIQIANEWDKIEFTLQNGSFWYFIYEGILTYENRIEFIFDLMKGKTNDDEKYFTFHKFNEELKSDDSIENIWLCVKKYFQTFEEWYNDRNFYHLVGYLVSTGYSIISLKFHSQNKTKTEFRNFLISEIKAQITYDIDDLKYRDKEIRPLLLLFNIQSLLINENSNIRFPFDRYKNDSWDIEHIRSIKSDKPLGNKQRGWLEVIIAYFTGNVDSIEQKKVIDTLPDLKNEEKEIKEITIQIWNLLQKDKISDSEFTPLYDKVLSFFKEDTIPDNINSISNLALLDSATNRGYKNAPFPVKRKTILENDMSGSFIPLCTKNVFLKSYSNKFENVMFWQESDGKDYLKAIISTLEKTGILQKKM